MNSLALVVNLSIDIRKRSYEEHQSQKNWQGKLFNRQKIAEKRKLRKLRQTSRGSRNENKFNKVLNKLFSNKKNNIIKNTWKISPQENPHNTHLVKTKKIFKNTPHISINSITTKYGSQVKIWMQ